MGNLLIGTKQPHEIWLGNTEIKQLYLGNNLIWEKPIVPWIFFDSAYIDGIAWSNNFYTFSGGTASGGTLSNNGIHFYSSSVAYANASTPVYIPWNATKLLAEIGYYYQSGRGYPKMSFGFLPNQSGIQMTDTSKGGILSETTTINNLGGGYKSTTFSLDIPQNYKCSSDYRIVINFLGTNTSYAAAHMYIYKVWFE